MAITNPRGQQNVEPIIITNQSRDYCFWLEKDEKGLRIFSKCYHLNQNFDRKCFFCHFGDISFLQRYNDILNWYFLSFIFLSKPFGWLLATKTVCRTNYFVNSEVKCIKNRTIAFGKSSDFVVRRDAIRTN